MSIFGAKRVLCYFVIILVSSVHAGDGGEAGTFFRVYGGGGDKSINNTVRLRVNDPEIVMAERLVNKNGTKSNGLMIINISEEPLSLEKAELYLELWGGHTLTAGKHFYFNGKARYDLPEVGTASGNCTYSFPLVPLQIKHFARGINAFQFGCEKSKANWGHYIIDTAMVRCYLKPDHRDLQGNDLKNFRAQVVTANGNTILGDNPAFVLSYSSEYDSLIEEVYYFGRYLDFDDDGDGLDDDWHGFTYKGEYVNHIGTTNKPPFKVEWDTRMIPTQGKPMAVQALVRFDNQVYCWSDVLDGLTFRADRELVLLFKCNTLPVPYASSLNRAKTATMIIPDLSRVERARLYFKIWEGAANSRKDHFTINGHPYQIDSGVGLHDVVFQSLKIDPSHLRTGNNELTLVSDTDGHRLEGLLPGPCLVLRYSE